MKPQIKHLIVDSLLVVLIFSAGFGLAYSIFSKDSPLSSLTDDVQRGMDSPRYYITVGTSVTAYELGQELPLIDLQELIEVDADGILGPKTVQKVLDLNRLELK